ncbi:MAG: FHA domain-containing protein [Chloroflexota bacterium]
MRGKAISGATAVLVLAFFFLPWLSVSLDGRILGQFSGYQLAAGSGGYALEWLNGRSGLFFIPFAAIVILSGIVTAQIRPGWQRAAAVGMMAAAVSGLAVIVGFWLSGTREQGSALTFGPEMGLWLTLLALGGAAAGAALFLAETRSATADDGAKIPPSIETGVEKRLGKTAVPPPAAVTGTPAETIGMPAKTTSQSLYRLDVLADDPSIKMWLVVQEGDLVGSKFRILPPVRLGRDAGNDIVIEDSALSGYHAVVREQGGAFHIQDLNSTNGIYLENQTAQRWQRVPAATLVNDMRLKLGRTIFQVVVEE